MKTRLRFLRAIIVSILIFTVLCCDVNSERYIIEQQFPEAKSELRAVLDTILKDAEIKNIDGLKSAHLNSDKFTKFGPRNFYRQDLESANRSEESFFSSVYNYKQEPKDLKIDVFGEIGIITYYPQVSFIDSEQEKKVIGRQTFVFLKTTEGWKIVHEHGTPKW